MLPGKSGFDVCRELRSTDQRTPVILLTARSLEQDWVHGLDVGANDYVTKPFSPRELAARVRGLLRYAATSRNTEVEFRQTRAVQETLLPGVRPSVRGVDYACVSRPAARVSGDYYDFVLLPSGQLALMVADVSGKGMPAALLGASLHAVIRRGMFDGCSCGDVLTRANQVIFGEHACQKYVTVVFGLYDASTRRLVYANAGHYPPLLVRGRTITRLGALTPPVGMFPDLAPIECVIELQAGDWLVILSDGISEAVNPAEEEFGDGRITAIIEKLKDATAAELCDRLVDAATAFAEGQATDDMTVLAVRILTES